MTTIRRAPVEQALLARLVVDESGAALVLEDATGGEGQWTKDEVYTVVRLPEAFLGTGELTPKQFEDIGLILMARLHAFHVTRPAH
jgi:hypothetical protein